jgi:hypothetical protein
MLDKIYENVIMKIKLYLDLPLRFHILLVT